MNTPMACLSLEGKEFSFICELELSGPDVPERCVKKDSEEKGSCLLSVVSCEMRSKTWAAYSLTLV